MTWVTVDIDLDQFTDEDIMEEYNNRDLGGIGDFDGLEVLNKIWVHDREGRKEEAYALMREYVLEQLNKVV